MPRRTGIVWFRNDLRLADNPALEHATRDCERLVCCYVLDESGVTRSLGGASRWWLAGSLRALADSLGAFGQALALRRGDPRTILPQLAEETQASVVYFNRSADPAAVEIERQTVSALTRAGVESRSFAGALLHDPATLRNGTAMQRFTPFWRAVRAQVSLPPPTAAPKRFPDAAAAASDRLEDWALEPSQPDWAGGLRATWTPGEAAAQQSLSAFADARLSRYTQNRDRLDEPGSSRLSPHLRFGEITPAQLWRAAAFASDAGQLAPSATEKFLAELGWREFAYHTLAHRPNLATRNLQSAFDAVAWRDGAADLHAWQRGETGYPIVDAAMRDLWRTGFMPNRARMIVASFLTKHLLIDWRRGEEWFWDTLVDADPANNPFNWQWVAGSGADAAPFFRIFNPVLQGQKFDPRGDYVRRHVPELARVQNEFIHEPWRAPAAALAEARVTLGKTYPRPIVEHAGARARALAAYRRLRA